MSEPTNFNDLPIDAALASLEAGFLVGNGRFTLIRLIGRGGMGVVWRARDESMREDVALKFLPPEIRFDAVALDDLRRETARARKLTHPNIIRIHDLCRDDREAFISMEFIDGANLSDLRLEQQERVFSWQYLEPLIKQLCEALDYAHSEKVVHRDLKPANMLLDSRGRLKLSDFGIAAQVSDSVSRVSMIRHGQSGTITHMSPQQMDGKLPQVTDDIYALGATLYELLTSRPPFYSGDIAHQVRSLPPQPLKERLAELGIANDVPAPVVAIIMACLAKSPEQRPQSARAVAEWIGAPTVTAPAPTPIATRAPAPEKPEARVASISAEADFETDTSKDEIIEAPRPVEVPPAISLREKARVILPPRPESEFAEEEKPAAVFHETPAPPRSTSPARAGVPLIIAALVLILLAVAGTGAFVWWKVHQAQTAATPVPSGALPAVAGEAPKPVTPVPTAPIAPPPPLSLPPTPPAPVVMGESVALFNGRDLTGWSGDPAVWSVVNGELRGRLMKETSANKPSTLVWRGGPVEDFELRISCRLLQAGNSGVYYRANELPKYDAGGYQFEISRGELGSLWDVGNDRARRDLKRHSSSNIRADEWHELTITAVGRHITHALDGQVLFELDDPHGNAPLAGVLALEATGGPTTVAFKNIRLRKIRAGLSTDGAGRSGWLDLFKPDQGLKGWFGSKGEYAQVWTVSADGTVTGSGAKSHLYSEGQYTNFEFKADVNLSPRANSGMYFRARPAPDYPHGYEAQLYNTGSGDDRKTGSLYKFSDVKRLLVSDNTWFNQHVIAVGNRIVIKVNGRVVVDYVDDQRTYTSGRLALQQISPTASVRFRNVLVKPLPEDATAAWAEVRRETPELRP